MNKVESEKVINSMLKKIVVRFYFPAIENGDMTKVKLFIEEHMNIDVTDSNGMTGLIYAALNGRLKIVKLLVSNGADINATDNKGETALMWAAFKGHLEVVKYLVSKGADVNAMDSDGRTALDLVNQSEKNKIAIFLKDAMVKLIKKEIARLKKEIADPKVQIIKFKPFTELNKINSVRGR